MEKYKLLKPITFEGEEVTEIEYDFDSLKGRDIIKAEREVGIAGSGDAKLMLYASPEFQSVVFAKAAKQPVELIQDLYAPDFAEVTALVMSFLMARG
jgi:hypothetical protein